MKIFGVRMSQIGDIVVSLPILQQLCSIVKNPYVYFSVAQKSQQIIPLLENHPLINEIKISDEYEDLGDNDYKIINQCDIILPVRPPSPQNPLWYNDRHIIEETAIMAGFNPEFINGIFPKLYINRDIPVFFKNTKSFAVWPFAGYGSGTNRSPSKEWWFEICSYIINQGHSIIQCGTDSEPLILEHPRYKRITDLTFADQIYFSLGCNGVLGTDSGSMWTIGAYDLIPQIDFITAWMPNHHQNKLAFAPLGNKITTMYADNGPSNIPINEALLKINEIFCI